MHRKVLVVFMTLVIVQCFSATGNGQMASDNYRITTSVVSGGGGPMESESGNYKTNATLGQPSPLMDTSAPVAPPGSTNYWLYPGFWYTLGTGIHGCRWDIEPESGDGDVDGAGLATFATEFDLGYYDVMDLSEFAEQFGRNDCL